MPRRRIACGIAALAAAGLCARLAAADAIQRDGFDGREPLWQRGPANVPAAEESHIITQQNAHSLPSSEYLRVKAEASPQLDPHVFYSYPTHPAPVGDDLVVRVWLRSNRSGVRLLARLVLPHERDPDNPNQPMTKLLAGEAYDMGTGHWQPLELRRPVKLLKDKQQELQVSLGRAVNVADAYIDRVVLNLYAGPGVTEVWIDDLEVGPVIEPKAPAKGPTPAQTTSRSTTPAGRTHSRCRRRRIWCGRRGGRGWRSSSTASS